MTRIPCPSESWDAYFAAQEEAGGAEHEAVESLDAYGHLHYCAGCEDDSETQTSEEKMNYSVELFWCASEIARGAKKAGFAGDYYELTDADLEYLRGEQCDSLECLPFADDEIQASFECDAEEEVNRILSE